MLMSSRCQLNLRFDGREGLKRAAMQQSKEMGITLTDFIASAIEDKLESKTETNDNVPSQELAKALEPILQRLSALENKEPDREKEVSTTNLSGEERHQLIAYRREYAELKQELADSKHILNEITQECERAWKESNKASQTVINCQKEITILQGENERLRREASQMASQESLLIDADAIQILKEATYLKGTAGNRIKEEIRKFLQVIGVKKGGAGQSEEWKARTTRFLDNLDNWQGVGTESDG